MSFDGQCWGKNPLKAKGFTLNFNFKEGLYYLGRQIYFFLFLFFLCAINGWRAAISRGKCQEMFCFKRKRRAYYAEIFSRLYSNVLFFERPSNQLMLIDVLLFLRSVHVKKLAIRMKLKLFQIFLSVMLNIYWRTTG